MSDIDSVGDGISADEAAQRRPTKRRRVGLACLSCRTRKSRCSGEKPKCSTCRELSLACQYLASRQVDQTVVVGTEQFQSIEDRLSHLEDLLRTGRPHVSSSAGSALPTPASTSDVKHHDTEDPTDGMCHYVFADEEDKAFFGPSSSIAFATDLARTMKNLAQSHPESFPSTAHTPIQDFRLTRVPEPQPGPPEPPGPHRPPDEHNMFYLPPATETTTLIDRYFLKHGILMPYIHEDTFRDTYRRLQAGESGRIRKTWLGLLNMVLAMATKSEVCKTEAEVHDREREAGEFYARASGLCKDDAMNGNSLEIVQYLLLVSQHAQGTKSSVEAWTKLGLAVRAAMQMGLHSTSASNSKRYVHHDREIRKRTWFACIVMDRTFSMTFGRPPSIPESYCRLELPDYFKLLRPLDAQDQKCRLGTDVFNQTISLYSILGKTIELLYGNNLGCGDNDLLSSELVSRVNCLQHMLDEWLTALPGDMGIMKVEDCTDAEKRHQVRDMLRTVLAFRYHNLRILIHRGVLQAVCHHDIEPGASTVEIDAIRDVASRAVQITIESASEIINILSECVAKDCPLKRALLPAWWYTLYYASDAALGVFIVFLAVRRCKEIRFPHIFSCSLALELFSSCIKSLHGLDPGNGTIRKCVSCLERLYNFMQMEIPLKTHARGRVISRTDSVEQGVSAELEYGLSNMDCLIPAEGLIDPSLPILDFDFMTSDRFGFDQDFGGSFGFGGGQG